MATGPTGARCQEWLCRLIVGSKLLLCSEAGSVEKEAVQKSRQSWKVDSVEKEAVQKSRQCRQQNQWSC
jgi:hypothetical protein